MARRDDREYREYLSEGNAASGVPNAAAALGWSGVPNAAAALGWSGDASPVECSQTFATGC